MTFWFSETKISPKISHFRGPQNSSIPREGPLETVPFLQKILIFWVPKNGSIPREGPLETVHFFSILPKK